MSVLNPYYEVVFRNGRTRLTLTALTGANRPAVSLELATVGGYPFTTWVEDDHVLARLTREALAGNPAVLDWLLDKPGLNRTFAEAIADGLVLDELYSGFNPGLSDNARDEIARTLTEWTGVLPYEEGPLVEFNLAGYTWMDNYDPAQPAWVYEQLVDQVLGFYPNALFERDLFTRGWTGRVRTNPCDGSPQIELRGGEWAFVNDVSPPDWWDWQEAETARGL